MDSELASSSDEADYAVLAGAGNSADPEAFSDNETPKDTNAPSSCVDDPQGVPISVRSPSNLEAVTIQDATFSGITLATRAARDGGEVPAARIRGHAHHQRQ